MNKQYRTCEHCGANLDADEKCDCQKVQVVTETLKLKHLLNVLDGNVEVITDFNTRFNLDSEMLKPFYNCEVQHIFMDGYSNYLQIKVKGY